MKIYTLYPDADGNPTITVGDSNIKIMIVGREGVILTEEEALEIGEQ